MWLTWLVMLRQTPETSIGTSIVRKKTPKVFHLWKGRMERVFLSRTSKRQRNSMVSLRMCSIKVNKARSRLWISLHISWTVTLIREINLISRNQLSLAKSTYKIKILWQMFILIALFSSKKVNGLMGGTLSHYNKFYVDFEHYHQL